MKTKERPSSVTFENTPSHDSQRETVEQILGEVARLGRFSPCAEMRSGSLAAMNDSQQRSLTLNGAQAAEGRGHVLLCEALRQYLSGSE